MDTPEYLTIEKAQELILQRFREQTRVPRWQIVNHVKEGHGRLSANEKEIIDDALRDLRDRGWVDLVIGDWSFLTITEAVARVSWWWGEMSKKKLAEKVNLTEKQFDEIRRCNPEYQKEVENLMLRQRDAEDFKIWIKKFSRSPGGIDLAFGERRMGLDPKVIPDMVENIHRRHTAIAAGEAEAPEMIEDPQGKVDTSRVEKKGRGNQSVYLYYFPTYKQYAKLKGETHWPCNVGKAEGEVIVRVSKQIGDQLPEKAKIALILRTDNCRALETEIHKKLKRRLKQSKDAIGTEWFLTSPSEVEEIYNFIGENSGESASSTLN